MVQREFAHYALMGNTQSACGLDASVVIQNTAKFRFDTNVLSNGFDCAWRCSKTRRSSLNKKNNPIKRGVYVTLLPTNY
jgi:hypothetical protein